MRRFHSIDTSMMFLSNRLSVCVVLEYRLTLEPTSRLLARILFTWDSAMSARSSASSSSCCNLRNLLRWVLACSSCRVQTKHKKNQRFKILQIFFFLRSQFEQNRNTYGLLSSSLVGFDFKLQFVHQVLKAQGVLPIFLSLTPKDMWGQSISYIHYIIYIHKRNVDGWSLDFIIINIFLPYFENTW